MDKNTTFEYVEADKENNIVKSAHPSTSRDSSAPIMMSSMSAHPVPSRSSNTKVDHLIVPNTIPECLLTETNEIIDRLRIAQEYEIQDIPDIKFQSHLIDKLFPKKSYHTLSAINSLFCKYCGTNDHPLGIHLDYFI